jgi:hypothetical protein
MFCSKAIFVVPAGRIGPSNLLITFLSFLAASLRVTEDNSVSGALLFLAFP